MLTEKLKKLRNICIKNPYCSTCPLHKQQCILEAPPEKWTDTTIEIIANEIEKEKEDEIIT